MPGMLPSVNRYCIEQAVRSGLGLNAEINRYSVFERKNYFYPDLPNGYQISQYAKPLVGRGELPIDLADGRSVAIGITRLHVEMDAGKSLHDQRPDATLVDLNRSGVALMEIVSEPDLRSAERGGPPAGIALYGAVQEGGSQAGPPLLWLLFLVLGMLAAVVALTAVPTSISTRQPIAQILQSETA